jgi:hypothetical protein
LRLLLRGLNENAPRGDGGTVVAQRRWDAPLTVWRVRFAFARPLRFDWTL